METNLNSDISGDRNMRTIPPSFENEGTRMDSWRQMFSRLSDDLSDLYQKERQLIQSEVREKTVEVKSAAGSMAVGGALLVVGVFCAAATLILLLAQMMNPWIAGALVTIAFCVGGYALINAGKKKFKVQSIKPQHSIDTLKEAGITFKERINDFRSLH